MKPSRARTAASVDEFSFWQPRPTQRPRRQRRTSYPTPHGVLLAAFQGRDDPVNAAASDFSDHVEVDIQILLPRATMTGAGRGVMGPGCGGTPRWSTTPSSASKLERRGHFESSCRTRRATANWCSPDRSDQ